MSPQAKQSGWPPAGGLQHRRSLCGLINDVVDLQSVVATQLLGDPKFDVTSSQLLQIFKPQI